MNQFPKINNMNRRIIQVIVSINMFRITTVSPLDVIVVK